jgi:small-conductance mechanosensitive channel
MSITDTLNTLLPALAGLAVVLVLLWLVIRRRVRAVRSTAARMRLEGFTDDADEWLGRLRSLVRRSVQLLLFIVAAVVLVQVIGIPGVHRITREEVLGWLAGPGFRILLIVVSAWVLVRGLQIVAHNLQLLMLARGEPTRDRGEHRKRVTTVMNLLRVVSTVAVVSLAVLMVLAAIRVNITPILTGAGIAGLAVGFGAQNLVRDVISGFFLILEDQVRVGDVVSINGKGGLVESIRLRTIALRGLDGTVHVIPNGAITELSNMTKDYSFAVLDVGVAYKEDVDRVTDVLGAVGAELQADPAFGPRILEPLEILGVDAFADSAVVIKVRFKTIPIQQWNVGREMRRRIKRAFDAQGIEIPFPHLSVYFGEASKPFGVRLAAEPGKVAER